MGIFDSFNQRVTGLGLPGGLGLLQAGTDILGGQPIGQAVRGGLQTFQGLQSIDEERKRKALVQKLISEGGFTPQERALIAASQNPAAVIQQINARKAAAANRPPSTARGADGFLYYTDGPQRGERVLPGVIGPTPEPKTAKDADGFLRYTTGPQKGKRVFADVTGPTPEPKTAKDADGFLRFTTGPQKGERVFPDATGSTPEPTTAKAADGFLYYTSGPQKGERVFPDAQKPPSEPIFREFDGDLYKVNAEGVLELVEKGTKDTKFVTVNGKVFRQDGQNLVEVLDESKPQSANLINLLATRDFTLDGQLIKKGQVFALDKNSQAELINKATDLQTGGAIIAPSAIENITSDAGTGEQPPAISPVSPIEIETAAGGDVVGFAKDFFNIAGGFLMFGEPATARRDERSNLAALQNAVLPGLVRSISSTGAVRTQEAAQQLIPSPFDNDNKMASKVNALIPVLQQKLQEADNVLKSPGKITASQRTLATQITSTYPQIISALEISKDRYEKRNTKSDNQIKADKILEETN